MYHQLVQSMEVGDLSSARPKYYCTFADKWVVVQGEELDVLKNLLMPIQSFALVLLDALR
jgi:hypothetical protein